MSRKAIQGYTEKSYYDNTRFRGIVATNDPLNEGSFKHLVNFDISDTGQSVEARKGFLSTRLNNQSLNKNTIYFLDPRIGKYIFVDFSKYNGKDNTGMALISDLTLLNQHVSKCPYYSNKPITNIDVKDLLTFLNDSIINPYIKGTIPVQQLPPIDTDPHSPMYNLDKKYYVLQQHVIDGPEAPLEFFIGDLVKIDIDPESSNSEYTYIVYDHIDTTHIIISLAPVDVHLAQLAYNEYRIPTSLIRLNCHYKNKYFSFICSFIYREQGTRFEDHIYENDTLVISHVNLDDTKSIISGERNIASDKSIIPNPIQHIYEDPNDPDSTDIGTGDISKLPLIYIKDINNKYLLETTDILDNITFIPHYILRHEQTYNIGSGESDLVSDYRWHYTYDIVSLNKFKEGVYRAPIYDLRTNTEIPSSQLYFNTAFHKIQNLYQDPTTPINPNAITNRDKVNECYKKVVWGSNNFLSVGHSKNTYVLYLVPKPAGSKGKHNFSTKAWEGTFSQHIWVASDYDKSLAACLYSLFYDSNEHPNSSCIFRLDDTYTHTITDYSKLPSLDADGHISKESLESFLDNIIESFGTICDAYLVPFTDIKHDYFKGTGTLFTSQQTALSSKLFITNEKPISLYELKSKLLTAYKGIEDEEGFALILRWLNGTYSVDLKETGQAGSLLPNSLSAHTIFPGLFNTKSSHKYYIYAQFDTEPALSAITYLCGSFVDRNVESTHARNEGGLSYYKNDFSFAPMYSSHYFKKYSQEIKTTQSIFTYDSNKILQSTIGLTDLYKQLNERGFFSEGIYIIFYILYSPTLQCIIDRDILYDAVSRGQQIIGTPYQSSRKITYAPRPNYIVETITKEPSEIRNATNMIIFREPQGDRFITWIGNTVYMSEPGEYNYFKYTGKKEYPNTVVKVIQYKDTLLVFTTSDVYSIFPFEDVTTVQDGTNDKGEPKYVQVKSIVYNTLPVLYNLMIDEKYKDAIQVFNQMVLFYSADGQMFMIKPSATVDSNTRFSIQYFNKNANDILENYDQYINERLAYYGKDKITKEEVKINVQLSINNIKIFYTVPNVITYILVYDVIKNNYYVYDTISFTEILDILPTSLGDVYITPQDTKLYLTQQYNNIFEYNNNIDMHEHNSNIYNPVITEIDTGVLNLNNHLKKRFKEIQTIYKNLNAQELEFSLEVFVDDIPVYTYYTPTLEVTLNQEHNHQEYKTTEEVNSDALLDTNTVLFNFSAYNSNATISHKTSIISKGKTIRLKFIFKSQGKYKVLGYGLIYKERRV